MASSSEPISVLFVCLGNICRSTMGEAVLKNMVSKPPYQAFFKEIDSCGTASYHIGDNPDSRTMRTLRGHGITNYVHRGRQIATSDFEKFDYIFAMDRNNLHDLQRKQPKGSKATIIMFGEFGGGERTEVIEDPYYGGKADFESTYEQCVRCSENFLKDRFPDVEA